MTQKERIKAVIKWLIGNGIAANQAEVGKLLGYSNETAFSKVINGKVSLPSEFTYKLCALDERLNESWVSEGWGQMIKEDLPILNTSTKKEEIEDRVNQMIIERICSILGIELSNPNDCSCKNCKDKDKEIARLKEELSQAKSIVNDSDIFSRVSNLESEMKALLTILKIDETISQSVTRKTDV